ncbi:MAG TPA: site-specific DNA-methyltransferase [Anaerolineae bacterium]|nr:site-specific DNA-methyltransferase [Anaerolineae bacterium]HXK42022.1 site-specific DNA-methyltransferase [Anaerolineae bacterium]
MRLSSHFDAGAECVLYEGDCLTLLKEMPDDFVQLVVTSPPYNLGKPYESRLEIEDYLAQQRQVIEESVRVLKPQGSICWQVGNYVDEGEIIPLDIVLYPLFAALGLQLRNRIVWHFGHGLHASKRFSGRYEVILWFTKTENYVFNLDAVRVPQKYPQKKYFKGPKKGELSGNPLGKNPGDVWEIPNVKANHVEKTIHPCQFPVELIERLVLALTNAGDWVFDPFMGVGTTAIAALMHQRRAIGAEIMPEYVEIAKERLRQAENGQLRIRPMERPVYDPHGAGPQVPPQVIALNSAQLPLLEEKQTMYDAPSETEETS